MAVAESIDVQVQALFNVVQTKKKEIEKLNKPVWLTNCTFSYDYSPQKYNLQTISSVEELLGILSYIIVKHQSHLAAIKSLELNEKIEFRYLNFTIDEWRADIKTRIDKITINKKVSDLQALEQRLDALVSPELKRKMELEEIERLLNTQS